MTAINTWVALATGGWEVCYCQMMRVVTIVFTERPAIAPLAIWPKEQE